MSRKKIETGLRVGNFIVERKHGRLVFSDLNGIISHSIDIGTAKGVVMSELYDACQERNDNALKLMTGYMSVFEFVLSVIPFSKDGDFLSDLYRLAEKHLESTRDMYRCEEGDEETILKEERERVALEEAVMKEDVKAEC